ncbi:YjcQ family protein [Faecalibaculum rodentium]|uniref:YjcQ family protein n=1 Tax=Faecalibaculum rodentium TaxID=1702221 RepID=UPI001F56DD23|nr:YjcQ family protein [Faecalibaculum rodentium]
MSKTDLHVIVYKLLRYVYEFNRHGILPDLMNAHDLVPVPERYFNQAVRELSYGGFVRWTFLPCMEITLKGDEFLTENRQMQKARDFLGIEFEARLSGLFIQ